MKKTTFSYRRGDGNWQEKSRETDDRGNGAAILLYDPARRTVILTRRFRYPAFVNGCDALLIEAPAGLLDKVSPEERIRAEAEEETGYRVHDVTPIFQGLHEPGSVTENLHFFVGRYTPADWVGVGGGNAGKGEDIDVLEVGIDEAMAMVRAGTIMDGKTIMLLQHAALTLFGNTATSLEKI